MNKQVYSLALGFFVLAAAVCGAARAESAHNAQTGAQTSNPNDTPQTAEWKQDPDWQRLGSKAVRSTTSKVAAEPSDEPDRHAAATAALPADELERIQNEN